LVTSPADDAHVPFVTKKLDVLGVMPPIYDLSSGGDMKTQVSLLHGTMILVMLVLAACGGRATEPPPPSRVVITFIADRTTLQPGECTMLRWDAPDAFAVMLDGQELPKGGEMEVCPAETSTYTLEADLGDQMARREVEITVTDQSAPPSASPEPTTEVEITVTGQSPPPSVSPEPTTPGIPAYQAVGWVALGGPPGDLGYDIRYNFADHNIWYVTDASGGFFISTDRGMTWHASNLGIDPMVEGWVPVFSATVDPHNPNTIWIGTTFTGHIYRSTDGGGTWERRDNGVTPNVGLHFRGFTVDPRSSNIVYAAAEVDANVFEEAGREVWNPTLKGGRVYRTTNGGESWELIWEGDSLARYVWIDPTDPSVIYVSTGIFDRAPLNTDPNTPVGDSPALTSGLGVLKSTDGGETWRVLGRENGLGSLHVSSLYMHPQDPQTLLAGTGHAAAVGGVYLTTDDGETWQAVVEGDVIGAVEFCEQDPRIAYAAGWLATYRSEDGGRTWQEFGDETRGTWGPPGLWPGVPIDMQTDPDDCRRVFINNYVGGNFVSTDSGETWTIATVGYTGAKIRDVMVNPADSGHVYAAARMAPFVSTDGGQNWQGLAYPVLNVASFPLVMDPSNPQHLLGLADQAGAKGAAIQSYDGGLSWTETHRFIMPPGYDESAGPYNMGFHQYAFAASDSRFVYAASINVDIGDVVNPVLHGQGVYRSTDGGTTWEQANDASTANLGFSAIAVDPTDSQIIYAASADAGIFKTTDGGAHWTPINNGLPEDLQSPTLQPFFNFIVIVSSEPQTIFAGGLAGVYKSADGGASWRQLAGGIDPFVEAHDLVIDPTNGQVVYLGTATKPYYSTDGGETFQPLTQGLDDPVIGSRLWVLSLALSADGSVLYAGTSGHGVYRLGTPSSIRP
jgi:photosystem II stability/assembly factor-like uncharacterized protein